MWTYTILLESYISSFRSSENKSFCLYFDIGLLKITEKALLNLMWISQNHLKCCLFITPQLPTLKWGGSTVWTRFSLCSFLPLFLKAAFAVNKNKIHRVRHNSSWHNFKWQHAANINYINCDLHLLHLVNNFKISGKYLYVKAETFSIKIINRISQNKNAF